jgi:hypothetical protein
MHPPRDPQDISRLLEPGERGTEPGDAGPAPASSGYAPMGGNREPEPLRVIKVEDIDVKAEPDWLIHGMVPAGSCALLVGEPKTGKTWLAADLAVSIASMTPFLEREAVERVPVLYVPAEDSIPSWGDRVEGLALARGLERRGLQVFAAEDVAIRLEDGRDLGRLRGAIEQTGARLVILDPLAMLHGADENKSGEMLNVLRGVRYLSQQTGATILVTHHMRKPNGTAGRRAHRIRGSSALHGWADAIFLLEAVEKTGGARLDVEARAFRPPPPIGVRLETAHGPDGRPRYWHAVEPVEEDKADLKERIIRELAKVGGPLTRSDLAKKVGGRKADVLKAIQELVDEGKLRACGGGVELVPDPVPDASL